MDVVCTLFEGDYHLGACALINSLYASGFRGPIYCGHRGPRPPWERTAREVGVDVRFVALTAGVHFTFYKPEFLRQLLDDGAEKAARFYYFDPDIVVRAPWPIFERWAADGLALCEDVNPYLPSRHPYRLRWADFLSRSGLSQLRPVERYYNAGFIGLPRQLGSFIDRWRHLNQLCAAEAGDAGRIKYGGPHSIFHTPDQDALNLSLMSTEVPVNGAGPESMGFGPGSQLMSHAIGDRKPWRGAFLRDAAKGRTPNAALKAFFDYAAGPIPVFGPGHLRRLKFSIRLAALVGRIYRRN